MSAKYLKLNFMLNTLGDLIAQIYIRLVYQTNKILHPFLI